MLPPMLFGDLDSSIASRAATRQPPTGSFSGVAAGLNYRKRIVIVKRLDVGPSATGGAGQPVAKSAISAAFVARPGQRIGE